MLVVADQEGLMLKYTNLVRRGRQVNLSACRHNLAAPMRSIQSKSQQRDKAYVGVREAF